MHLPQFRRVRILFIVALLMGMGFAGVAIGSGPVHAEENHAPTAYGEDYTIAEDTALEIAAPGLLANDEDPDGDGLSVLDVQGSGGGNPSFTPDGGFRYVPQADANGADFFIYNVTDGALASNYATVNVTITPVDDPPVAVSDAFEVSEDTPLTITSAGLTANDTDVEGDGLSAVLTVAPLNGTITGDFVYTPNPGFSGTDTFSYVAFDNLAYSANAATVILTVQAVNHPPVAVDDAFTTPQDTQLTILQVDLVANDSDPDGDFLTLAIASPPTHGSLGNGDTEAELVYVPNPGFTGTDRFTYVLHDGTMAESSPATVTITVTPADLPPPTATPRPTSTAAPRPAPTTAVASSGTPEATSPTSSHAEVIAQTVVEQPDGPLAWTVTEIDADESTTEVAGAVDPGFLLGIDGAALARDAAGTRTRLAPGEALAVNSEDELSLQSVDGEPANLALLGLRRAQDDGSNEEGGASATFESPGGSCEVELLRDVLSQGEQMTLAAADAPIFVLVTEGAIELETGHGETQSLAAAETALVTGEIAVTGKDTAPSSFVAAVIESNVDAAPDATPHAATRVQHQPQPRSADTSDPPTAEPEPAAADGSGTSNPDSDALVTDATDPAPESDGSDPSADSDGDGLTDGDEALLGTDPDKRDTDGDGASDGDEVNTIHTNPLVRDTDGDGWNDFEEALWGLDPNKVDTDGDGLGDHDERYRFRYITNSLKYDTDGDGLGDGDEYQYATNPLKPDTDEDGLTDTEEIFLRTNPFDVDTDNDGYGDGAEVYDYHTWPLDKDDHP
jgi:hypothetical protein